MVVLVVLFVSFLRVSGVPLCVDRAITIVLGMGLRRVVDIVSAADIVLVFVGLAIGLGIVLGLVLANVLLIGLSLGVLVGIVIR